MFGSGRTVRWLFGHDVFISYSRADGSVYAAALANALAARDFSCYLDQWGAPPDAKLPDAVVRALKRSTTLVLLATPRAGSSVPVRQELDLFRATGRTIVPVDFDGTAEGAPWFASIEGLARSNEPGSALTHGQPSEAVLSRIANCIGFARRNRRVRWTFSSATALVLTLALVSVFSAREAKRQEADARAATAREQQSLRAAQSATREAQLRAEEARQQARKAQDASREALVQQQAAQRNAREAVRQQQLAQARQRIARSQELASLAQIQLPVDPAAALQTSIEAVTVSPSAQAQRALRQALSAAHLRRELHGHTLPLTRAAFSPDGAWMFTGGDDPYAQLWRVPSAEPLVTLRDEAGDFHASAFGPGSTTLIAGSRNGSVKIWDLTSGRAVARFVGHTNVINDVAISPDGQLAVSASEDGSARLWRVATGEALAALGKPKFGIWHVAFTPDSRHVLTAGGGGSLFAWDARTGAELGRMTGHEAAESIRSMQVNTAGTHVLSAGTDGSARLWEIGSWTQTSLLQGHAGAVNQATFSPDGRWVATAGEDGTARLWDWRTARAVRILRGHVGALTAIAFSPDANQVITAGSDRTVRQWSRISGRMLAEFRGHGAPVAGVDLSPDGHWLLTRAEHSARLWHRPELAKPLKGHRQAVNSAHFSADGRWIVTASEDGSARLWSGSGGEFLREFRGHDKAVMQARLSRDGRWLVTAGADRTARLWESASARTVHVLKGHEASVTDALFRDDGQVVMTASEDGSVRLWDRAQGHALKTFASRNRTHARVRASRDARHVAHATEFGVTLWNVASEEGVRLAGLGNHDLIFSPTDDLAVGVGSLSMIRVADARQVAQLRGHQGPVRDAAFSADGRFLVSAGADHVAKLWHVPTGQWIRDLTGHAGAVEHASFSADGRWILTVGHNDVVQVWERDSGEKAMQLELHAEPAFQRLNPPRHEAEFSPDARAIVVSTPGGTAQLLRCEPCAPLDELMSLARARLPKTSKLPPPGP